MEKIYFVTSRTNTTLVELFVDLYTFEGIFQYKANQTFCDPDFTKHQCHVARRSFGDLLAIANTYLPGTTEEDVVKALVTMKFSNPSYHPNIFYCSDIDKCVCEMNVTNENIIYFFTSKYDRLDIDGVYSLKIIDKLIEAEILNRAKVA